MLKITLISNDLIGPKMAGPGIRYLELAKFLSANFEVNLLAPEGSLKVEGPFSLTVYPKDDLVKFLPKSGIILTQEISAKLAMHAKKHSLKLIYDAYDPLPLEYLEIFKDSPKKFREYKSRAVLNSVLFSIKQADGIICASAKQRDLWMGAKMAGGGLDPTAYDQDPSFLQTLSIVPFGLPSKKPLKTGPGFRKKFNLDEKDPLLIWGGGIWNWFDPLTLIEAMPLILAKMPTTRLVFMGIKHPNPDIPAMQMAHQAIELAKDLHLLDKNIFFNQEWIAYEERQNYLLEATAGVSMHFEHLETQYSFRTRILDYLWTHLPMIVTRGDFFSELVLKHDLGYVVPPKNPLAIAEAVFKIVDEGTQKRLKQNIAKSAAEFTWEKQGEPLLTMLPFLASKGYSRITFKQKLALWFHYLTFDLPRESYQILKRLLPKDLLNQIKRGLGYGT